MEGFICASCKNSQPDYDGVLEMTFDGWGDRGLIDTFGSGPQSAHLCYRCAKEAMQSMPWIAGFLKGFLNINYAHTCLDGGLRWTPESACLEDFDRHGWRKMYMVRPVNRSQQSTVYYRVFDTEEEAISFCESMNREVVSSRVTSVLVGNLDHYTQVPVGELRGTFDSPLS